jgi:hypothetical protein
MSSTMQKQKNTPLKLKESLLSKQNLSTINKDTFDDFDKLDKFDKKPVKKIKADKAIKAIKKIKPDEVEEVEEVEEANKADEIKTKKCRKCEKTFDITNFSVHKQTADGYDNRCKDCVKEMKRKIREKINEQKVNEDITPRNYLQNATEYLDEFEPDLNSIEWQGGKLKGTIFKRKDDEKYTITLNRKTKIALTMDEGKKELIKMNKKENTIKNMYKIITYKNKKYVIMQLSNDYVGLFNYEKLDLLKKINLSVTKSSEFSNANAKYYCMASLDSRNAKIHNIITNFDMCDHINRYPLDNRVENISTTTYSDNNKNKSSISYKKIEYIDNKYIAKIKYLDKKEQQITYKEDKKIFDTNEEALEWINKRSNEINNIRVNIIELDDNFIELKKDYETIMTKYADNFKWCDSDDTKKQESKDKNDRDDTDETEEDKVKWMPKEDKYKQFKDIDKDFTIKKYNINLKLNNIQHLTFENTEYKFCSKCHNWNDITHYKISSNNVDKLNKYCNTCDKEYNNNRESTNKWRENNKEKVAEYDKKYREENREKILLKSRKSDEDKEKGKKERQKIYYDEFVNKCNEHGGSMISSVDEYESAHTKLVVKCSKDHEFEISWNNCKNNKWCKKCYLEK